MMGQARDCGLLYPSPVPVRSAYPGLLPASEVVLYWYPCPDTVLKVVHDGSWKGRIHPGICVRFALLQREVPYFALS